MKISNKIDNISGETPVSAGYRGKQIFWNSPDKLTTVPSFQVIRLKNIQHDFFTRYEAHAKELSFKVNQKEMSLEEFKTFLIHNGFRKQ